jgi:hypothetical protein
MPLKVSRQDHHFASSVETTSFTVQPPDGKKIVEIALVITDAGGAEVYKQEWTAGTIPAGGKYKWDGEDNQSSEDAADGDDHPPKATKRYVTPLGAPYTATFTAKLENAKANASPPPGVSKSSSGDKAQCELKRSPGPADDGKESQSGHDRVWVLYREVKFEPFTWADAYKAVSTLDATTFPDSGTLAQKKLWLAYKLNELGYIAGPIVDPPVPEPLLRALFRYTQAHPDLPKFVHYSTLGGAPPGACNWGWRPLWEAKFGTLDQLGTGGVMPDGDDLISRLKSNERPRKDLVETPAALPDRSKETRVILDHDIYYLNKDFLTPNANADYDKEFLNPFCHPFRIKVFLVSQKDRNATKPGVDAPKGLGNVDCTWVAYDPPDDLSLIPPPPSARIPLRSRARAYVDDTHRSLAGQYGDSLHALDNCPADLGGVRPSDPGDMSPFFTSVQHPEAFPDGSAVFFRGSYIGGDNYIVQAALSLKNAKKPESLKNAHRRLSGLAKAFNDPVCLGPNDSDLPLTVQSAKMTLWRRHHVLREVTWDSQNPPPITWGPVVENYKAAHVILVPPAQAQVKLDALLPAATLKALAQAMVADPKAAPAKATKAEFDRRAAAAAFNPGAMYPLPWLNLTDFELAYPALKKPANEPVQRFESYTGYLTGQNAGWPAYDTFLAVARQLREALDSQRAGPGIVALRVRHMPIPDFATLLPADVFSATSAQRAAFAFSRGIAVGMDYGIAFLDSVQGSRYEESYFVSHEISHCLFGSHPFEVLSVPDHDTRDKNCLMYYNEVGEKGNSGAEFGWALKAAPDKYIMRVLVEYDPTQKAECGTLSDASWQQDIRTKIRGTEWRVFKLEADVAQIRKSFSKLKFTPAKWLDSARQITICLESPLGFPAVSPKLSVAYPFPVNTSRAAGAIKPFADITVEPVDVKSSEPRFCGKCVLKLRGWRVFPPGAPAPGAAPAIVVPDRNQPRPIDGRMEFMGYKVGEGEAVFWTGPSQFFKVNFALNAKDPDNSRAVLGPYRFLHEHKFSWQSSTGNLQDLTGLTREVVRWDAPTQASPFNNCADPDQQFAQTGGGGSDGKGTDDHSMRCPGLICQRDADGKPIPGIITAEQSYQYCLVPGYSTDPADWMDIPNSHFLLQKSVYYDKKHKWVLKFTKTNNPEKNPVEFRFEVCYKIGPAPTFLSRVTFTQNQFAGAQAGAPVFGYMSDGKTITQEVWAAGSQTMDISTRVSYNPAEFKRLNDLNLAPKIQDQATTLAVLIKKGLAISGTT